MKRMQFDADTATDERPGARPAPDVHTALKCDAPGCQWRGSAGYSGRFSCIAHLGAEANDLPSATARTIELTWFAKFIGDVQRMANFPRKGYESWMTYADTFWAESDPSMQPTLAERRAPGLYQYRMLGELRAKALGKDRPAGHVPQGRQPGWQPRAAASGSEVVA